MESDGTLARPDASALCTSCGLCCAGLFGRVRLAPEDLPLARRAGSPIVERDGVSYARLPCAFLRDTVCTVYAERYAGCRSFSCALLGRYARGEVDHAAATVRIAEMRRLLGVLRGAVAEPDERQAIARAKLNRVAFDLYADRHFRNVTGAAAPTG